ncbi:hypothetical protein [Psychroserpens sp. NJDZ02]|uniref:TapB family protein n=1 Tax=Psychroserpens sp. NJDZ02 TaxID=2570561 RepID=UPI0010A7C4C0|nr:hypothetical protein [Psychroserpens sp. NJDZ02]QCE40027.1 hypothetical protein E9099_00850 [Psychroserpens sp. NJDZ02]
MKKILTILTVLLLSSLSYSQTCEDTSPYKEGMILEYTNYNKKGKEKSVESHTIETVSNEDGNLTIYIKSIEDKTPKEYILKCINGDFYVDMSNYTTLQNNDNSNNFKVKATGDFLEFPDNMEVGTVLKDGTIDLAIGDENSSASIATMNILNRKILANESLTTKAGTFDGYKVSFDYIFNIGIIKFRGSGIEWYVKGIGIIKSENYSKKGKLRSSRVLTKITNN